MKKFLRWLGFCGHEWEWNPHLEVDVLTIKQTGFCMRCGKAKRRHLGTSTSQEYLRMLESRSSREKAK